MDNAIVAMLNALSAGADGGTKSLLLSPQEYNQSLYDAAVTIHSTAVKPVTAIVLSIVAVLMLATNSARVDGDRELGIRIVSATMFKVALVFIACQNAILILNAIAAVATSIAGTANNIDVGAGGEGGAKLGDSLKEDISDAGTVTQLGMLVILLLPFIVVQLGSVIATVLVFIRFLQMYMMTAFASLPIAFLSHDDTKQMGIGYLKRFGVVAISGVMIILAVKMYQALVGGWLKNNVAYDGDMWNFVISNFGQFFVAPIVLIFLLFGANGLAKAIVGEG